MSFNNEENDEFNEIIDKRNLDNSFSDLSSISNQSMKEIIKEDLFENIKLTSEKPKKEKKKRRKEDLNNTHLYIYSIVFSVQMRKPRLKFFLPINYTIITIFAFLVMIITILMI